MSPDTSSSLNPEQKALINEIFQVGWSTGSWPTFADMDRPFHRQGMDAQVIIHTLVPGYIRRDGSGPAIQPGEILRLTFRGASESAGRETVIPRFLEVLEYLVEVESSFVPVNGQVEPTVSQIDVANLLARNRGPVIAMNMAIGLGLLLREERNIHSSYWVSDPDKAWSITVSRQVRIFQGVRTLEAYLERTPIGVDVQVVATTLPLPEEFARVESNAIQTIDPRSVFVVHGRDMEARKAILDFLEALGLNGFGWDEPVSATGSATPFTGRVVEEAFNIAHAVIVLLTPDEMAKLHPDFQGSPESHWDSELRSQVRPNVLFEAGMAFTSHPHRTVIVEIGMTRRFSDIEGRNTIRLRGDVESLRSLARRLEDVGCPVNRELGDWENPDRFVALAALNRSPNTEATSD